MSESVLTDQELAAVNAEIEKAKQSLSSKEVTDAVLKVREEVKREAEENKLKQEVEAERIRAKELEDKLKTKEIEAAQKLAEIQKRVDELISSKAVVSGSNPIISQINGHPIDRLSDDQINNIEKRAAREYFGERYSGI